jgi:hypothetical protein
VLLLMGCGLLFIFAGAYWGDRLPSHAAEVAVTMTGSCLMIAAHFINHTFCKNCRRCDKTETTKTSPNSLRPQRCHRINSQRLPEGSPARQQRQND